MKKNGYELNFYELGPTLSPDCRGNFEPPDKGSSHLDAVHMTLEIDFATEHGDIRIGEGDLPSITDEGLAKEAWQRPLRLVMTWES